MVVGKKGEVRAEEVVTRNVAGKLGQGRLSQMVLETLLGKFCWKGCKFEIPRKRHETQGHFLTFPKRFLVVSANRPPGHFLTFDKKNGKQFLQQVSHSTVVSIC